MPRADPPSYRADGRRVVAENGTVVSGGHRSERDAQQMAEKMNGDAKDRWVIEHHPSDCYCDKPAKHVASLMEVARLERKMGIGE